MRRNGYRELRVMPSCVVNNRQIKDKSYRVAAIKEVNSRSTSLRSEALEQYLCHGNARRLRNTHHPFLTQATRQHTRPARDRLWEYLRVYGALELTPNTIATKTS